MYIASPFIIAANIATAPKIDIRRWYHHIAVTATDVTHTACHDRHQGNPQSNFDSVHQTIYRAHANLPFVAEVEKYGGSRNNTRHALLAMRTSFSA